ncbi:hypothetical protein [Halostella litorea]|uniref:hypothetical protein n=1 Tax=Halostella litorea TaxID=2528831 RepID=UPI001F1FD2AE|nr:hypothetical protein [Halostella litorea]
MSEDTNDPRRPTNVQERDESPDLSASDVEALAPDPDLADDLGYETIELDVVHPDNGSGDVIVLPADEDLLKEDAFMVSDADSVCDVGEWR